MKRLCIAAALGLSSCASLREQIMGKSDDTTARAPASVTEEKDTTALGDQEVNQSISTAVADDHGGPNLAGGEFGRQQGQFDDKARRGYRRNADPWTTTGPYNENSLWNPESQDGFYFTRNNMLRVGDFIVVNFEPDLMENLNNRLVKMYKTKKTTKDVVAEETGKAVGAKVGDALNKAVKNDPVSKAVAADVAERAEESLKSNQRYFTTKEIPVRVTEITAKGLLRVQGEKTLFLKNASFELKLGGMLREEDIGPTRSIASSRVIESKVEITK